VGANVLVIFGDYSVAAIGEPARPDPALSLRTITRRLIHVFMKLLQWRQDAVDTFYVQPCLFLFAVAAADFAESLSILLYVGRRGPRVTISANTGGLMPRRDFILCLH
jgi:hypothetical protein